MKRRAAAGCALAAVATSLAGAFAVMAPYGYRPSALVHMGASEPIAQPTRAADPGFAFVPIQGHYDGVYYFTIGRDPLARGSEHKLIDRGAYRYGHPGFGWLGWLGSAGQAKALPYALLAVALACAAIAGALASLLAGDLGLSPWLGLVLAVNPGLIFAVTNLTSEAAGLAALLASIYLWRRENRLAASVVLAAACLIKEQFLLVPVGLAVYELVAWFRARRLGIDRCLRSFFVRLAPLAVGPLVYLGWFGYVSWQFAAFPTDESRHFVSIPFTGWVDTFKRAEAFAGADLSTAQIGAIEIPLLVAIGSVLVIAAFRAIRVESEVHAVFLLLAVTVFSLNWWNLLYPKDLLRAVTAELALLPFVFSPRRSSAPGLESKSS